MNIVANFISNETITCGDRNPSLIKTLIRAKDNFYKKFIRKSNNMYHLYAFKILQNHSDSKKNYVNKIPQRLGHPSTSSKCYWSFLKTLLNGQKILRILSLFHDDKYIVGFQKKR